MDRLDPYSVALMPERAPMPMARQSFSERPSKRVEPAATGMGERLWRLAVFAPAILLSAVFLFGIAKGLARGGMTVMEVSVLLLAAITCVWISLAVSTVAVGLLRLNLRQTPPKPLADPTDPLDLAVLVPLYNEVTSDVFGNASAMIKELASGHQTHRFTLYLLSDTQDPQIAEEEERAFAILNLSAPQGMDVYYRRRQLNKDRKVGNLNDWIENWGARHDAMLVLDADSLMSAGAIHTLADTMAADPDAGLIQSCPSLIRSETLFGRMQEFSNAVYGWLLAEGLSVWAQREGNYWGHNAIIRIGAFAESAHLPYLRGRNGKPELILSHDFVEAGMLRRAGWGVRFLPRTTGSYEETPPTLIDHALRDRRWCQGNLQHLRLLAARGFHPMSRFHMLQGAVAFLLSPAWFALIIIWSMLGPMADTPVVYFSPANPLYPIWPEGAAPSGLVYLGFIYTMLLLPKVTGMIALGLRGRIRTRYGGWVRFAMTALVEILCSIIYAPIMMVQQSIAVILATFGRSHGWSPQRRQAGNYGWAQLLRFHLFETVIGAVMISLIATEQTSLWLLPIAISLALAVPLSRLSGVRLTRLKLAPLRLESPQALREPRIVRSAWAERAWIKKALAEQASRVPAE